jgi:hypothetical protein
MEPREWVAWVFWSVIGQLVLSIIPGVVVAMWGALQKKGRWSRPTATVYGIIIAAALYSVINQSGLWEAPAKIKIHKWFDEAGFSVKEIIPTQSSQFEFRFEVIVTQSTKPNPEIKFYAYRPKYTSNAFVWLETGYSGPGSFPTLKNLDKKAFARLRRQLQKDLALLGLSFNSKNPESLDDIIIRNAIAISSLTQERLLQGVEKIFGGLNVVVNDIGIATETE